MIEEELDAILCFIDIGCDVFIFELFIIFIGVGLDQLTFLIDEDDVAGRRIFIVIFRIEISFHHGFANIGKFSRIAIKDTCTPDIGECRSDQQQDQSDRFDLADHLVWFNILFHFFFHNKTIFQRYYSTWIEL